MLFSMVTTVMLYTGLVYSIFMTLVTNESIQLISATIYDIGYKWFNIEFEAVTVLIIISILILIVIHMIITIIITKIIYVILREIDKTCEIGRANMTYNGGNNNARNYNDNTRNLFPETKYYGQGGREITRFEDNWQRNNYPEKYDMFGKRKHGK